MASQRPFLGVLLDLTGVLHDAVLKVGLKPGLADALQADIDRVLETSRLTSAEASKLRGKLTWASCGMFGKCGRAGQAPLVQRQYRDTDAELTAAITRALHFYSCLLQTVKPREILLGSSQLPPIVCYTDASWEPEDMDSPGLGFILQHPGLAQTLGGAASVQADVLHAFRDRQTQIMEMLAVLQCFVMFYDTGLENRDVILLCDNQAVSSCLIKGACSTVDITVMVEACHLLWARMNLRVWVEYVPSDDNPTDGLSRQGLSEEWTSRQPWATRACPCIPWHQLCDEPLLQLPELMMRWRNSLDVCWP